jgi:hypothetical protein
MTDEEDFSVNLASIEIPSCAAFLLRRELLTASPRITVYLMLQCH